MMKREMLHQLLDATLMREGELQREMPLDHPGERWARVAGMFENRVQKQILSGENVDANACLICGEQSPQHVVSWCGRVRGRICMSHCYNECKHLDRTTSLYRCKHPDAAKRT